MRVFSILFAHLLVTVARLMKSGGASGNAFLDGQSGDSEAFADADQNVTQSLDQLNMGIGGDGGDDNVEANTNINI